MTPTQSVTDILASLRSQAEELAQQRRVEEAIARFQRVLELAPADLQSLLRISDLRLQADRYGEARRFALRAHETAPSRPEQIAALAARLRTFNEPRAILADARRTPLRRWSIPLLLQLAQVLSSLNLQTEAFAALEEARKGDPRFPPMLSARGQVLTYLGRLEDAVRDLQQCVALAPELAHPHWLLSRLRTWTAAQNHVPALQRELGRPGRKPDDVARLAYALHKELDDLGRTDEAWTALELACKTRRAAIRYDAGDSARLVERLMALPTPAVPTGTASGEDSQGAVPVFIVGMHRSGTSLLEQVLAGHDGVRDMGELYDFTAQMRLATDHYCRGVVDEIIVERSLSIDMRAVGQGYLDATAWRCGTRAVAVDKLPSNFLNLGFILQALPRARVLHMVRDPMETCFSNLRELFSDANPYSYDQIELAEYFAQYRLLMKHWSDRFPGRILDVHYDRLVGDSESTIREIASFCGLAFQEGMLRPGAGRRAVATASAVQVRGAIERRAIAKWRPYADRLEPLRARLRSLGVAGVPD